MIKILLPLLDKARFLPAVVRTIVVSIICGTCSLRLLAGFFGNPDFQANTWPAVLISAAKYAPSDVIEIYEALTELGTVPLLM